MRFKTVKNPFFLASLILISLCLFAETLHAQNENAGPFSLKDFKKQLRSDSSDRGNAELKQQVLIRGVTFEYTYKRERDLRKWGANDELLGAIYQSIVDENDEARLYSNFFDNHKSGNREERKSALETGRLYLSRFESNERFTERAEKLKKDLRFLECEFDPSLGC
ncbi:MAG: hypothetical protein OEM82_13865 [Acidobacteriota bacterium]|nr:hypothetical protein [Acidobacteriota bacterium]MDH3528586.1 hypothetical protein [Acidobacteriota bacterium]